MKKFTIRTDKMNDNQLPKTKENKFMVFVGIISGLGLTLLIVCIGISFFAGLLWLARSCYTQNVL